MSNTVELLEVTPQMIGQNFLHNNKRCMLFDVRTDRKTNRTEIVWSDREGKVERHSLITKQGTLPRLQFFKEL